MKNPIATLWKTIGTVGQIFLVTFVFFLFIKAFKH